jgi:2-polyprenyl-3-methyl-5-hydroxy-6-metoxy-1,4-benzoquinol methylase
MGKAYEKEIDLSDLNNARTRQVIMTGEGKRVIEFGCSTGYVSRAMKLRGCYVAGVEVDPEATEKAKEVCDMVIIGDLDELDLAGELGEARFDVGLFGDVLEHLKYPQRALIQARRLLAPGGYVVVSVPNIAHASIRLALLEGEFDYEVMGILDDTHLKYYTRKSIVDLLEGCGFVIDELDWTEQRISEGLLRATLDPLGLSNTEGVVKAFSSPEAVAFQYIIKASPAGEPERMEKLSEEKVEAERRARALEKEIKDLQVVVDYSRQLEDMLEQKDGYIRDLEAAATDRDGALEQKEQQAFERESPEEHHRHFLRRG